MPDEAVPDEAVPDEAVNDGPSPAPAPARVAAAYQELILEHYRRPRGRGAHDQPDASAERRNPLCGDEVRVTLLMDGDVIREARAESRGCSIAAASASMLTEAVAGRTRTEVAGIRAGLEAVLAGADLRVGARGDVEGSGCRPERSEGPPAVPTLASLGDLHAFAGLARFPARHRCARLPWEALEAALEQRPP